MSDFHKRPVCGRCGVYRHLHPTAKCVKSRRSFWWDEHMPVRHVVGVAWLATPQDWRWNIVSLFQKVRPDVCRCDLVEAVYLDDKKDDYRGDYGCGCDVPRPSDAGKPRPGWCYCAPLNAKVQS